MDPIEPIEFIPWVFGASLYVFGDIIARSYAYAIFMPSLLASKFFLSSFSFDFEAIFMFFWIKFVDLLFCCIFELILLLNTLPMLFGVYTLFMSFKAKIFWNILD